MYRYVFRIIPMIRVQSFYMNKLREPKWIKRV